MNFLARHNQEPFSTAHDRIDAVWVQFANDEDRCLAAPDCMAHHSAFVLNVDDKESLRPPFDVMVDFYSALSACVDEGICDRAMSRRFSRDEASAYFHRHHALIMQERKEQKETKFGAGLQSIGEL